MLEGGYSRLKAEEYAEEEEPAITGELRNAMNGLLRDTSAPDWANYFSVHDDPPVDDGVRKGKRRNRIDIRVDASIPRPGASFSFEAKRLARGFTVAKYIGEDGLGSFLSGEYAREEGDAGMIGYVQDDDAAYWSGEMVSAIQKDRACAPSAREQMVETALSRPWTGIRLRFGACARGRRSAHQHLPQFAQVLFQRAGAVTPCQPGQVQRLVRRTLGSIRQR